jgi:hypothetical protein
MNVRIQAMSWLEKHITIFNLKFKLQRGLADADNNKRSRVYKKRTIFRDMLTSET